MTVEKLIGRCIIAGSRSATQKDVDAALAACPWSPGITRVVTGCARGADTYGVAWAQARGLPVERFPAYWEQYGRHAGHIRNMAMAMSTDALVAAWDGKSRGTRDMIHEAEARELKVFVWHFGREEQ